MYFVYLDQSTRVQYRHYRKVVGDTDRVKSTDMLK